MPRRASIWKIDVLPDPACGKATFCRIYAMAEKQTLFFLFTVLLMVLAANPSESRMGTESRMNGITLTLESLKDRSPFKVTLQGQIGQSFLAHKKCLYFEWHYGEKTDGEWISRTTGYQTTEPLILVLPEGQLEIGINKLRLYLSPTVGLKFTGKEKREIPEVIRERLAETGGVVIAEEFVLEPGKTYYARVGEESYLLPPDESGRPIRRHNTILELSDKPFVEGKPRRPITPAYRGWTY
jgi:hypothetical protein